MRINVPSVTSSRIRPAQSRTSSQTSAVHTVRKGDTLSSIVRQHLKQTGQSSSASAIYSGVQDIARANGISNPDRIDVGQRINLGALGGTGRTRSAASTSRGEASSPTLAFHRVLEGPSRMSSPYGMRQHPIHHDHRHHNGIDLAAARNTPITPMRPGIVTFSGWKSGYGNTVVIRHEGGIETQYSHAEKRLVKVGQQVDASTVVATVGSSGNATGPHLHLEVSRNGRRVNPLPYLMTEPVHAPRTRLSLKA